MRGQSTQRVPTIDLEVASLTGSIASSLHVSPQRSTNRPNTPEDDRKPAAIDLTASPQVEVIPAAASTSNPGQGSDDSDVEFLGYGNTQPPSSVPVAASASNSGQGNGHEDQDVMTRVSETTTAGISQTKSDGAASNDRAKKKRIVRKKRDDEVQKKRESPIRQMMRTLTERSVAAAASPIDPVAAGGYLNDEEAIAAVLKFETDYAQERRRILQPQPVRPQVAPPLQLRRQQPVRPIQQQAAWGMQEAQEENPRPPRREAASTGTFGEESEDPEDDVCFSKS